MGHPAFDYNPCQMKKRMKAQNAVDPARQRPIILARILEEPFLAPGSPVPALSGAFRADPSMTYLPALKSR
jgi:hypothetical protein